MVLELLSQPELQKQLIIIAKDRLLPPVLDYFGGKLEERKAVSLAERYAGSVVDRIAFTRTFIHYKSPVHVRRIYREMSFRRLRTYEFGEAEIADDVRDLERVKHCVALIGYAGCGKTLALKHLCLQSLEVGHRIPVFLEFRRLVPRTADTIGSDLIEQAISNAILPDIEFSRHGTAHLLRSRRLLIVLDGFDEIPVRLRKDIASQLDHLTRTLRETQWIIGSRPDHILDDISQLAPLTIARLSVDSACDQVDRYDVSEEVQDRFKAILRSRVFDEHHDFASNPLLLAVLFITYLRNQHISSSSHVFFEEVFDALCTRHDERKGGYQRTSSSSIPLTKLVELVELFSFESAVDDEDSFAPSALWKRIVSALAAYELDEHPQNVINDFIQFLSVLIEEGGLYLFLHRSLQEFLAARYLSFSDPETMQEGLSDIVRNPAQSLALKLMHDMNPSAVDRGFVLPLLDAIEDRLIKLGWVDPERYCVYIYRRIHQSFTSTNPVVVVAPPWRSEIGFIQARSLLEKLHPEYDNGLNPNREVAWWTDTKPGVKLSEHEFVTSGLEFYRVNRHFGAAGGMTGFDPGDLDLIKRARDRTQAKIVQAEIAVRRRETIIQNAKSRRKGGYRLT